MSFSPKILMNDGRYIDQLGFGIWSIPADQTAAAVSSALGLGYRLVDGAWIYGNEAEQGAGLKASGIERKDVFLTSKVWNNSHGRDKTRASVERSLTSIGVDQLDLVLIHWPVPMQNLYVETWETLIELQKQGKIASIGVSNFNADHLKHIIDVTGVTPAINQIEVNPQLQQPELCKACKELGVLVQAWTPLGNGAEFASKPITDAAARTGKSPAQVVLRWLIQRELTVITRSVNPARQAENLNVFDFELTDAEMAAIATLDKGLRTGPDPSVFKLM